MIQETIRAIRLQKKISQKEMAAHLKLSRFGYAKLEKGAQSIRFDQFEAILAKLGHSIVFMPNAEFEAINALKTESSFFEGMKEFLAMFHGKKKDNPHGILQIVKDRQKPQK